MEEKHSDLELVKHDSSAGSPQRSYGIRPFELDGKDQAPEVHSMPQVCYSKAPPENAASAQSLDKPEASLLRRKSPKWWIALATVLLLALIALGVGIGVGIAHRQHSTPDAGANSPPTPQDSGSPTPMEPQTSSTILNDTSIAAICLPNGDRQLYFQDVAGSIRRTVRLSSSAKWTLSPRTNISSNAQDHTALAVAAIDQDSALDAIQVFYIDEDAKLRRSLLKSTPDETWVADNTFPNFTTKAASRHLSIAATKEASDFGQQPGNNKSSTALLLYENSSGAVSTLISVPLANRSAITGLGLDPSLGLYQDYWIDITSRAALPSARLKPRQSSLQSNVAATLYESYPDGASGFLTEVTAGYFKPAFSTLDQPGSTFGAPFVCENVADGMNLTAMAFFYAGYSNPAAPFGRGQDWLTVTRYTSTNNDSHGMFNTSLYQSPVAPLVNSTDSPSKPDIALITPAQAAIWINDTQPACFNYSNSFGPCPVPESAFPFSRLASVKNTEGSSVFLYHQLNGTTFVEEQWIQAESRWIAPAYITVKD